mmetsp:Transcript_29925/g.45767  ORF Transcript_29925/g.45767 Transcript_29925/m.45767 type:complete len:107 (+) Transcript_29925:58-378(+)
MLSSYVNALRPKRPPTCMAPTQMLAQHHRAFSVSPIQRAALDKKALQMREEGPLLDLNDIKFQQRRDVLRYEEEASEFVLVNQEPFTDFILVKDRAELAENAVGRA